jgi:hypothetical protein
MLLLFVVDLVLRRWENVLGLAEPIATGATFILKHIRRRGAS